MAGIISDLFGWDKHLEVEKDQVIDLIGEDAIIIDVRSEKQRNKVEAIFEENIHVEYNTFKGEVESILKDEGFSKDDTYVVFCKTGSKGLKATKILRSFGFEKTFNMKYGTNAWYANDDGCGT